MITYQSTNLPASSSTTNNDRPGLVSSISLKFCCCFQLYMYFFHFLICQGRRNCVFFWFYKYYKNRSRQANRSRSLNFTGTTNRSSHETNFRELISYMFYLELYLPKALMEKIQYCFFQPIIRKLTIIN